MTDVLELEIAIKRAGITKRDIAKKLNISLQTLYNKLNNSVEFKASEIAKTCELLRLNRDEKDKIFFAVKVDK